MGFKPVKPPKAPGWRIEPPVSVPVANGAKSAANAAAADVAATLIANAVNLPDHPAITRRPACDLHDDSDLGDQLVTTQCGPLSRTDIHHALQNGQIVAEKMRTAGLIRAASLFLQGESRQAGHSGFSGQHLNRTRLNA